MCEGMWLAHKASDKAELEPTQHFSEQSISYRHYLDQIKNIHPVQS